MVQKMTKSYDARGNHAIFPPYPDVMVVPTEIIDNSRTLKRGFSSCVLGKKSGHFCACMRKITFFFRTISLILILQLLKV